MMESRLQQAHVAGYERIVAWADLLDQINVFPVADSDTGRNLKISLAPLLSLDAPPESVCRRLLVSATGNSGNIAASFFTGFAGAQNTAQIPDAARSGRDQAWQVLADPQPGTMLSVMDALVEILDLTARDTLPAAADIVDHLAGAVSGTTEQLPVLKRAGVVDAGALGLHIYLEGFFRFLAGTNNGYPSITDVFRNKLQLSADFTPDAGSDYCVDTLVRPHGPNHPDLNALSAHGRSVVAVSDAEYIKIHLHTEDRTSLRKALESVGSVVNWKESLMADQPGAGNTRRPAGGIHIMTDAAGSFTPADAGRLGVTLLESILVVENESIPETLFSPEALYDAMRTGKKVATAQSSIFVRHQSYQNVLGRYDRILYLCVGSVYTTNFHVACAWKTENDPDDRLTVIDSSSASGGLGIIALATARFARQTTDFDAVVRFAESAVARRRELIFLDQLKYLARGGRISKTKGFFGDLLNKKPIISPMASGAERAGVVRTRAQQVEFALQHLEEWVETGSDPLIMLEYTDNLPWLQQTLGPAVQALCPAAEILFQPLSLTSGAHMGPGTWGLAVLPAEKP
ncbi:MAG: DegV family protein [Desulfobacterales bacterium]|nr:DegV family protein [Desulfobacterales bacterium]